MDKEIVVQGDKLKRLVGWLEKKSLPMRAFYITSAIMGCLLAGIGCGFLVNAIFGLGGLLIFLIFIVAYIGIFVSML